MKRRSQQRKSEVAVVEEPPPAVDESAPLTLDEQIVDQETINELPPGIWVGNSNYSRGSAGWS
jgi:hypothetical protein